MRITSATAALMMRSRVMHEQLDISVMIMDKKTDDTPVVAETWRPVVGFEGSYEVSNLGRIRSLPRNTRMGTLGGRRLLKQETARNGYLRVCLSRDGTVRHFSVHRLVLDAFVGIRMPGQEGCHQNGIRADNCLANLRWDSRSENARDRVRHGTQLDNRGEKHGNSRYVRGDVDRILDLRRFGLTRRAISAWLGMSEPNVGGILLGKRWKHLGVMA